MDLAFRPAYGASPSARITAAAGWERPALPPQPARCADVLFVPLLVVLAVLALVVLSLTVFHAIG
jgi:hypothetical protein